MAEKKSKSRAEKAVSDVKKKTGTDSADTKSSAGKGRKKPVELPNEDNHVPGRVFLAIGSLGLFIMLMVMAVKPEGALLRFIYNVIVGLIGKAAFYFAIPAMLYTFIITISSARQPIKMRCICLTCFVFLSSCIYHLMVNNQTFVGGFRILGDLWKGGAAGTSGGLLCGLFAMTLRWACGNVISYIVLIISAVLTLLASMKITIPSIIRAIRNRPRDDWDAEEFIPEKPEPAAMVVNHIANKRIEQKRAQRAQKVMMVDENALDDEDDFEQIPIQIPAKSPKKQEIAPVAEVPSKTSKLFDVEQTEKTGNNSKKKAATVENPPVAPEIVEESVPVRAPIRKSKALLADVTIEEPITSEMPLFRPEDPIPDAPVMAQTQEAAPIAPPNAKVTAKEANESAQQVAAEIAQNQALQKPVYCFPPIDLLKRSGGGIADGTQEMRENSKRLNDALASFKIDAHIINVTRGPSVTRYEVELDKGVRLNKLTTVADDLALSLGAVSVRIAPVPGKISVVGIEVPNRIVTNVNLREVIDSQEFNRSKSKSTFAVGKDIAGSCIVGNIAKMPHMLIAGTTGSGKSVCMNSIIISLLYKASPDEVKLIMVDPKMVELGIYNGIPHLLIPVVTDPKKAAVSLQWAVVEMMRRYKIMSDAGVRDLESYNSMVDGEEVDGEKMPQIVVIIDELADLMLVAAKEVEDSICRIAQMGRAAGMHLIIATQRPSADVITGLMKANIPSRIAFSVASAMESRIILDTQGAEKLVGKGDMLFAPIGTGKPQRVQGCFVTDSEVEAVAGYVKSHYMADYDQQVLEEIEKKAVQTGNKKAATALDPDPTEDELAGDEMLPAAVDVIMETGQASVSMLQRRLKLGYARAARIVDEMEEKGIVGPFQGSKPRAILITKEQWEARKNGEEQMEIDDIPFDEDVPDELL